MNVKRYDFDCYAFYDSARLDVQECADGDYVLHSDYADLLARHNALVEAVAWEREIWKVWLHAHEENININALSESNRVLFAARAEVDRLLVGE